MATSRAWRGFENRDGDEPRLARVRESGWRRAAPGAGSRIGMARVPAREREQGLALRPRRGIGEPVSACRAWRGPQVRAAFRRDAVCARSCFAGPRAWPGAGCKREGRRLPQRGVGDVCQLRAWRGLEASDGSERRSPRGAAPGRAPGAGWRPAMGSEVRRLARVRKRTAPCAAARYAWIASLGSAPGAVLVMGVRDCMRVGSGIELDLTM
jgi:hypothetical protein